jgi:hypothetical protein
MTEGAPDYVHLRQILARDALGNLVPVACDPSGRIILLPYGTQTVSQDDPLRTIQGADGVDLYTIAVDASGRLIMLPYGWDGATYRPLKVDDEGRMIGVMKGQADVKWGLRGWWKFIVDEGTRIKDYSGHGNNGDALSGAAAQANYEDGVIGQSLLFDGVDDYVACGADSSLDFTTENFTIEFWMKPEVMLVAGVAVYKGTHAQKGYYIAIHQTGYVYFITSQGGATQETRSYSDIVAGTWFHVVVVRDGVKGSIYINGVDRTVLQPDIIDPVTSDEVFCISAYQGIANFYKGLCDEVRVYGRALSIEEVQWRYEQTNPTNPKPTRMIAVDSEGRMEVNIHDLPYKSRVLEHVDMHLAPGGGVNIYSSYVPLSKVWMLTSIIAYTDTADCDSIDLGIYDGSENHILSYIRSAGACQKVVNHGELILKAGDRINVGFTGLPLNAYIVLNINGYELDAP